MISCRNARADSLGVENALGRTTANCAERIALTRYGSSQFSHLSRPSAAGNLAGDSTAAFSNTLDSLKKLIRLGSSPGHHIFFISQLTITLYLGNFGIYFDSNLRGEL